MKLDTQLRRFLADMEYPATRDDLVREARRESLDMADVAELCEIPNRSYDSGWDVRMQLALQRAATRVERTELSHAV